jgi:hypothetical protein
MSNAERQKLLEDLGAVPDYAEMPRDWYLAEKTSWWGKPLNPSQFWKGRTIWLDKSAGDEARARGRAFPPVPFDDPSIPEYKGDKDTHKNEGTIEGPNIHFHWNGKEAAFWAKFAELHPRPPEEILAQQERVAETILGGRFSYEHLGNPARTNPKWITEGEKRDIETAIKSGFPREAFSEEALFWTYVAKVRADYQDLAARGITAQSTAGSNFLARVFVPLGYITGPSAEDQLKAAWAWRSPYLRRLKKEGTDESYITAYLKAWNLSADAVFGDGQTSP